MFRLLEFLKSLYVLLLFIALECVAILYYVNSNRNTNAKALAATAWVSNSVNGSVGRIKSYFMLDRENRELVERIMELESELTLYRNHHIDSLVDAMGGRNEMGEVRVAARVVTNTLNRRNNYIIIDRGSNSGVHGGMALVTPLGEMVGEVLSSYENYSVVMSVLNSKFSSSGRMVESDHAGSIKWKGADHYTMLMSYVSKYAQPRVGAEVVTTNFSSIFPEGVKIGRVTKYNLNEDQTTYQLEVELAADISSLDRVIAIGRVRNSEVEYINEMIEQN